MPTKILTVDDSLTVRLVLAKAFQPYDCELLQACNGKEGLAIATREKPELILLDLCMPVMDGDRHAHRTAELDPILKSTPVIMLTAESDRTSVFQVTKLGVSDYILKPFREDLFVQRVIKNNSAPEARSRHAMTRNTQHGTRITQHTTRFTFSQERLAFPPS